MEKFYNFDAEWESEDKQIEFLDLLFSKCENVDFKKIEISTTNGEGVKLNFADLLKDRLECIVAKNGIEFTLDDFGNLTEVKLLGSNFSRDNGKTWEMEEEVYKIN